MALFKNEGDILIEVVLMKAIIIRFKEPNAICVKEDIGIICIKRINIPIQAKEGDVLNIEESSITIESKMVKEKYIHVDDIIIL
jgi:Protein of unknown function (DUF3006).